MRKLKTYRASAPLAAIALMIVPLHTKALVPVTDYPILIENIISNTQALYNWAEEKSLKMMEMEMQGLLQEMSIENQNNATANMTVRLGNVAQDIQNKEIEEMAQTDSDSSSTVVARLQQEAAACYAKKSSRRRGREVLATNTAFTAPMAVQMEAVKKFNDELVEACAALSKGDADELAMYQTACVDAGILHGSTSMDTLDADQSKAMDRYIELITGGAPELKRAGGYAAGSETQKRVLVEEMRVEALRSLAATSLQEIKSIRQSPNTDTGELSVLHNLSKFNEERYGSVDWLTAVQNTNKDKKNTVMQTELLRKIAVMDAYMSNLMLMQYKQSLRAEALQAALLSIETKRKD